MIYYAVVLSGRELTIRDGKWVYTEPGKGLRFVRREDAELFVRMPPWVAGLEPAVVEVEVPVAPAG